MKKQSLQLLGLILVVGFTACNEGSNTTKATSTGDQTGNTVTNPVTGGANDSTSIATGTNTPFNAQDSTFVMKAAMGGLMEVAAGTTAQQKASNERVKAFAAMMANDHQKANQELMSIVGGRLVLPQSLPADQQNHMNEMGKMSGKAFDTHYMGMMVSDHEKTIADFEKQANSGTDAALKAFAAKSLPVLRMHRDSAVSINQAIK